jgi:hypothetical protein
MDVTIGKIIALLIAIGYIIAAILCEGLSTNLLKLAAMLLVPLVLIWFPDECGGSKDRQWGHFHQESPGILVSFMGWFFLVGMPIILYLIWRS